MKSAIGFLVAVLLGIGGASGHARPEKSEPKVGEEMAKPPAAVRIWFDEEVVAASSSIRVLGADGKEVDKKDTHVDAKDRKLLIVSLPDRLAAGTYEVKWQAHSVDGHRTHDQFKFVVKG